MTDFNSLFDALWRNSIGYDNIPSLFTHTAKTFPRYDIIKSNDDEYVVSVALAGYSPKDVNVLVEKGTLKISSDGVEGDDSITYLHRGVAKRAFNISLALGDHVEVTNADFINGMLNIYLKRLVPEEDRPRKIPILPSDK